MEIDADDLADFRRALAQAGGAPTPTVPAGASQAPAPPVPGIWRAPRPAGNGDVVVTRDVLANFIEALRECVAPIDRAQVPLASITGTHAGYFPHGMDLDKKIGHSGEGDIKDVLDNGVRVQEQINTCCRRLDDVLRRYDTTQELNDNLVNELSRIIGESFSGSALPASSASTSMPDSPQVSTPDSAQVSTN
ncbi:hypothetical protein [Streptomyces sp. NPDC002573]|uniref:hypothetical protein n=1 Tax=Streptomyces sp. NPDC002573 TaxID=3364651 RepID=UPI003689907E